MTIRTDTPKSVKFIKMSPLHRYLLNFIHRLLSLLSKTTYKQYRIYFLISQVSKVEIRPPKMPKVEVC